MGSALNLWFVVIFSFVKIILLKHFFYCIASVCLFIEIISSDYSAHILCIAL